jgi:hypothetical protein
MDVTIHRIGQGGRDMGTLSDIRQGEPAGEDRPTSGTGVLVTGSHRSGTTWLGKLLAAADELHYVHEPFNIVARIRWTSTRPPQQFHYVTAADADRWASQLSAPMQLRLPVAAQFADAVRARRLRRLLATARAARAARHQGCVPLLKDPIALFSTPWLAEHLGLRPVVLVRGPVAFVGSLKARNWTFDFRHWTGQPLLMDGPLAPYRDAVEEQARRPGDIIEQGIVQWNAMYHVVDTYRRHHPDWLFPHHEQLAADPQRHIPEIYDRLGLRYGPTQQRVLTALTAGVDGTGSSAMDVHRSSSAVPTTWRHRLDHDEVTRILRGTEAVAERFALRI